jgi:ABC-type multidrug transport system ATPase subunit
MPILDTPIDEEFDKVKLAAKDLARYAYRWLLGQPPELTEVTDFLPRFEIVEEKLATGAFAYDVFNELTELAMAAKISTFAEDVRKIQSAYFSTTPDEEPWATEAAYMAHLPSELQNAVRDLLTLWRSRFTAAAELTLEQLRAPPSIADDRIVDQEICRFEASLRLGRARSSEQHVQYPMPVVQCSGVSVTPGGNFLLRAGDFAISKGEIVACVGPNGSGKTTFLRFLAGVLAPSEGEVAYPFIDAQSRDRRHDMYWVSRRRAISFVDQEPGLGQMRIDKSISLNLASSGVLGERNRALTNLMLERFRLFGKIHRSPDELSSGERKLAAMACALSTAPDLILLDEPFSSLDYMATMHFLDDVDRIAKSDVWGRPAIVFSSHHVDEPNWLADRLLFFAGGEISKFGITEPGFVFEAVVRDIADLAAATQKLQESGLQLMRVSGRTFVKSLERQPISTIAKSLEDAEFRVLSVNDISQNPKRKYLGF